MGANIITWAGKSVTAQNDAFLFDSIQTSGIFNGCASKYAGTNQIHIDAGYGIMRGRLFSVDETTISVALPESGTMKGRLYLHLDLANADAPLQILSTVAATLPDLASDVTINVDNGQQDFEICTFTAGVATLTDFSDTAKRILNLYAQGMLTAFGMENSVVTISKDGKTISQKYADGTSREVQLNGLTITQSLKMPDGSKYSGTTVIDGLTTTNVMEEK